MLDNAYVAGIMFYSESYSLCECDCVNIETELNCNPNITDLIRCVHITAY